MVTSLNNFDPISFLGIDISSLSAEETSTLSISLNDKIGEYILLKFSKDLPSEQMDHITSLSDGQQILNELRRLIPDFEQRVSQELDNFKKEYQGIN